MEEFNTTELQNQAPKVNSAVFIRCAKVALLLSDLQHSSSNGEECAKKEVAAYLKRELKKLEKRLLKEREIKKKMRLDTVMELCIWIAIFFCLWNICLFVFFDFPHNY